MMWSDVKLGDMIEFRTPGAASTEYGIFMGISERHMPAPYSRVQLYPVITVMRPDGPVEIIVVGDIDSIQVSIRASFEGDGEDEDD